MDARRRKPFSDLTDTYNLIPTSTLRKLVATSSNLNSISKPQNSILKSNPSFRTEKLHSDSSSTQNRSDTKSGTSVGSSNISTARNSRTVQFTTPCPSISSVTPPGDGGSKNVTYSLRQTSYGPKKEIETIVETISSTPLLKTKDKGKAIAVPSCCPPPEKTEDNGNPIHYLCSSLEKAKEQEKENRSNVSSPGEKVEEFGKVTLSPSGSSVEKTKEIGKAVLDPSSSPVEKTKDKGKAIMNPFNCSLEKTKEKGKSILSPFGSSLEKIEEKEKLILGSSSVGKMKGKGASAAVPVNYLPRRRKCEKRVIDTGAASSCPPLLKTKNIRNAFDESGDVKPSMLMTDPHTKRKKKRCMQQKDAKDDCLTQDFIDQQRAYFKEVDEFELPEEEISQDELD